MFSAKDIRAAKLIIKNIEIPHEFGPTDYEESAVKEIIASQIPNSIQVKIESGASKIVIVPQYLPFVIKIPFNGQFIWVDDVDNEDGGEVCFFPFCEALPEGSYNYCERELSLIERAEHFGWGFLMPHMEFLGYMNGYPAYIQEKVQCGARGKTSENSLECARTMDRYYRYGPEQWRAAVIEQYGEPIWRSFVDWCFSFSESYTILDDLHASNVGIAYDGRPVILDVGGFND